jgi:hypothetical protein
MQIVADTHVHIYPTLYDVGRQLDAAHANLAAAAPRAEARLLCLAERAGQRVFADLCAYAPPPPNWTRAPCNDPDALTLVSAQGALTLIAGRQINTAERIEVLALGRDLDLPDGLPLDDTLARVRENDAIPVLPWGFGKWLGRRGRIVRNALDTMSADGLVFADTCLRPAAFPSPAILRSARARGFSILYGTDPLPRPGEELITGRWATRWEADWDASHPAAAWRRIIREKRPAEPVGCRCGMWDALKRIR